MSGFPKCRVAFPPSRTVLVAGCLGLITMTGALVLNGQEAVEQVEAMLGNSTLRTEGEKLHADLAQWRSSVEQEDV